MKNSTRIFLHTLVCFTLGAPFAQAGGRVSGGYELAYESLNNGGVSFATSGVYKLGGSIGQSGLIYTRTNSTEFTQDGFWKAENSCTLYPAVITNITYGVGQVGITFTVMDGNRYSVNYVNLENGGLAGGTSAWTNEVIPAFVASGGIGSVTTVYDTVSSATNRARYYLIGCD